MSTVPALLVALATAANPAPRGEIIDFSARWCGPCQQMAPLVARLEREGHPVRTIDVDSQAAVAQRFRVTAMPTFVLLVDGKEVDRNVGAMSEAQLRAWLKRIPEEAPAETAAAPAQAPAASYVADPNVKLGNSQSAPVGFAGNAAAPQSAPAATAAAAPPAAQTPASPAAETAAAPAGVEIRASDARVDDEGTEAAAAPSPMDASVRLRVTINGTINLGSGTIVESTGEVARIVTCGHIFRDFTEGSRIEVNLFLNGNEQSVLGELIRYDLASDVGLVQIATPQRLPTAPIARAPQIPQPNDSVINIGCSGGQPPTRQDLKVTAVNPYQGPDNLECTGVPVQGRSGGGLFKSSGELVGVCIAADPDHQRGVYAGLLAIHKLLEQSDLTYLYEAPAAQEPPVALASAPAPSSLLGEGLLGERSSLLDSPAPAAMPVSDVAVAEAAPVRPAVAGAAGGNLAAAGNAEIVCIIRPRNQPGADTQVVIIHEASPKLMSYLRGEIGPSSNASPRSRLSTAEPARTELTPLVSVSRPVRVEVEAAARPTLLPTSLSQQHSPRRYVRTASNAIAQ